MQHSNILYAKTGNTGEVDQVKKVFEERSFQDLHLWKEGDKAVISPSENMVQNDLVIAFNGYLESTDEIPEKFIARKYRELGGDLPSALNGSFRVAIYDRDKDRLNVFSDKAGRKVIYYSRKNGNFTCSSHLVPMLRDPDIDSELNMEGLRHFLQSWSVSFSGGPRLIKNVQRLYPSTLLVYTGDKIHRSQYWDVYGDKRNVSDREAVKTMEKLLREGAEKLVERTDSSLNVFLSGGFDSVFLTHLISQVTDQQINTYTWGWKQEHFTDAERMSEMLGTNQHSLKQDYSLPSKEDIWFYEEPHNAFARYPFKELYQNHGLRSYWTGLNSQATFPVCLKNIRHLDRARKMEKVLKNERFHNLENFIGENIDYKLSKGLYVLRSSNHSAGAVNDWGLRGDHAREMLNDDLRDQTQDIADLLDQKWGLERKSYQENYSYLQLRSRDTARYAYYSQNMEHIDVFGYTPLLEYSYSLPMNQKKNRRLLRKIAKGKVPDEIITKGASGWEFVSEQFRRKIMQNQGEYEEAVERFLERGFLDEETGRDFLLNGYSERTAKGPVNQMMAVFLLEKWMEIFIDRDKPWVSP
jgi:hypothetical protein